MALIRWRHFGDLDKLLEEINLLQTQTSRDLAADVYQENDTVIVQMQVAGINPDKIDISVEGDLVKISGSREEEHETTDRDYYAREIRRGSLERIIHLPTAVKREETRAQVSDGVLTISLPILNRQDSHKVKVQKH